MAIISNQGSIAYSFSGSTTRETAQSNVANINLAEEFNLVIDKFAVNENFLPGENITYQLAISNTGTGILYNVTLADDLGTNDYLTFAPGSAYLITEEERISISPDTTDPLTFILPSPLTSGETAYLTYIATVSESISPSVTSITNTIYGTANGGSATGVEVSANASATITAKEFANVMVTKSASENDVNVGESFSYTFTLTNSGNTDANDVSLTDALPENFVITSITSTTDDVVTNWTTSDYSLDTSTNTLSLPSETTAQELIVPASTDGTVGETTITITGYISAQ
ncbi:MAG: DUF11 domain-containing protein [Clostridia bacterium]|nr:DUF11 domain-containing protein [Clostridia bacterium]